MRGASTRGEIIGIDIGGTKTAVVIGAASGEIRWRQQFLTKTERGFEKIFEEICTNLDTALKESPSPLALSVAVGGPLDVLRGVIKSPPNLPGWDEIPLKDLLRKRFSLPVYIENDANAGVLAEHLFGAGRGFNNIIFLTMGTGIGAGLILNGKLYRGATDTAGEVGHIRVAETGPLSYGKIGSLEGYASGAGIAALAQMMYPEIWPDKVDLLSIYQMYQKESVEARTVFQRAGEQFGRGLAVLVDLLNPQRIILGGLGFRVGGALLGPAKIVLEKESLAIAREVCEIVPSELAENIGDVASVCAAIDQMTEKKKGNLK